MQSLNTMKTEVEYIRCPMPGGEVQATWPVENSVRRGRSACTSDLSDWKVPGVRDLHKLLHVTSLQLQGSGLVILRGPMPLGHAPCSS